MIELDDTHVVIGDEKGHLHIIDTSTWVAKALDATHSGSVLKVVVNESKTQLISITEIFSLKTKYFFLICNHLKQ